MRRGFTLIELLAVIVILAIIAMIATPIVLNIIQDAKKQANLRSAENIIHATELYVGKSILNPSANLNGNIYNNVMEMIESGKPDNGVIYINKNSEISVALQYGEYCYTKEYTKNEITVEKTDICKASVDYLMTVEEYPETGDTMFFNGPISRASIESLSIETKISIPSEAIGSWDVSEKQNGSIMAWYLDNNSNGLYEVYIGQDGGVKANSNSLYAFSFMTNITSFNLENLDTSNVIYMGGMFLYCDDLKELDLSGFDTSNVTGMEIMFSNCTNLESLYLSNFNTSNVLLMAGMFQLCENLQNLDISSFNTGNVTDMQAMFAYCYKLKSLNLNHFETSKVANMLGMFAYCYNLVSIDVSSFDTSKVTSMRTMFSRVDSLESLDLSSFNTSNVTDMAYMFAGAYSLKSLDVSSFDTSKVTNMNHMFNRLNNLESLDLSNFNTSNVREMSGMFALSSGLKELNLSSFDTSKVTDVSLMFKSTTNLQTIKLDKAIFKNGIVYEEMFLSSNVSNITVKDAEAKAFIESRLTDAGITATVTISS